MKYLAMALAFTLCTALTQAQPPSDQKDDMEMTTAQHAEIKSKKLALRLDLSNQQQRAVMELEKDLLEKRKALREEIIQSKKELPPEEMGRSNPEALPRRRHRVSPELHIRTLDLALAEQEEMKKILNEEQYLQWRQMKHKKKRAPHRRHAKGQHRPGRR